MAPVCPPVWFVLSHVIRGPGLPPARHPGARAMGFLLICAVGDDHTSHGTRVEIVIFAFTAGIGGVKQTSNLMIILEQGSIGTSLKPPQHLKLMDTCLLPLLKVMG